MLITLTIRSKGSGKWCLGLSKKDSIEHFTHSEPVQLILQSSLKILAKTAHSTSKSNRKFNLSGEKISGWITNKELHKYPPREPTQLLFDLEIINNQKQLSFKNIIED